MKRISCLICGICLWLGPGLWAQVVSPPFEIPVTPGEADDNSPGLRQQPQPHAQKFVALSQLAHLKIKNPQGEALGKIDEVVIQPGTGRAFAAVGLSRGKHAMVPLAALNVTGTDGHLQVTLNKTKAELEAGPVVAEKRWNTLEAPGVAGRIYSHYRLSAPPDAVGGTSDETRSDKGTGKGSSK